MTASLSFSWRSSSCVAAGSREVDDGVDALGLLLDLVCEATTAPDIDVLDVPTVIADDVEELVEARSDSALVDLGVEDDHQFVLMHDSPTSFGLERLQTVCSRRVMASVAAARGGATCRV